MGNKIINGVAEWLRRLVANQLGSPAWVQFPPPLSLRPLAQLEEQLPSVKIGVRVPNGLFGHLAQR